MYLFRVPSWLLTILPSFVFLLFGPPEGQFLLPRPAKYLLIQEPNEPLTHTMSLKGLTRV